MIFEVVDTDKVAHLFENMQDSLIWSCLQKVMGHIYSNDETHPTAAMAILGDFCFLAGEPCRELASYKPQWCKQDFLIMVPENAAWAQMIEECYGEKAKKVTRYGIKKEQDIFDKKHLQNVVNMLLEGYTLTMMDEELFRRCQEIDWCKEWVAQYPDYELYRRYGLGALVLKDGEPVSGASSYSGYHGGIEIEIKTHEDHRRKGLAYVCGAKLILECLDRDWYPNWDAQNKWSVGLAQKLGYHFSHEYTAYEIWGY
uniref:GNAT family N-acetyltransferase n=1 Tax=Acetatifactor sp. TaxID=1872090 RepID=UPI004055B3C8